MEFVALIYHNVHGNSSTACVIQGVRYIVVVGDHPKSQIEFFDVNYRYRYLTSVRVLDHIVNDPLSNGSTRLQLPLDLPTKSSPIPHDAYIQAISKTRKRREMAESPGNGGKPGKWLQSIICHCNLVELNAHVHMCIPRYHEVANSNEASIETRDMLHIPQY
jgi:hypothetical protein